MKLLDDLFHIQALDERYVTREINNRQITYKEYGMNEAGRKIMQGSNRDFQLDVFNIRRAKRAEKSKKATKSTKKSALKNTSSGSLSSEDSVLFVALKSCRTELARKHRVRAYNVATDQMLHELCTVKPTDIASLAEISGMGPHRLKRYGELFLEILQQHTA